MSCRNAFRDLSSPAILPSSWFCQYHMQPQFFSTLLTADRSSMGGSAVIERPPNTYHQHNPAANNLPRWPRPPMNPTDASDLVASCNLPRPYSLGGATAMFRGMCFQQSFNSSYSRPVPHLRRRFHSSVLELWASGTTSGGCLTPMSS